MNVRDWRGVFPALTTPFHEDLSVDYEALARQARFMVDNGCDGVVACGSLGEAATLSFEEKLRVLSVCVEALGDPFPVVAGVAGLSTAEAVRLARAAAAAGCAGLMVLPPWLYAGDWRELRAHFGEVFGATPVSCMLYNNPIAYGTDVEPAQVVQLLEHENLHAVKESSGRAGRVRELRARADGRLAILVGIDDQVAEGVAEGAVGWIAGLANALPQESVRLFELLRAGRAEEARLLNEWFLPLLRFDTGPKFVQQIKLVQAELGRGRPSVRPPRLELAGAELDEARRQISATLAERETLSAGWAAELERRG